MTDKKRIKRHTSGVLRGLAHSQLFRPRGLYGVKLGPANRGRRLDTAERQAIEQKMRDEGRL
jgi:hypothetical protein